MKYLIPIIIVAGLIAALVVITVAHALVSYHVGVSPVLVMNYSLYGLGLIGLQFIVVRML